MKSPSALACPPALLLLVTSGAFGQNSIIETIAGGGPNDLPALSCSAVSTGVLAGSSGEVYFAWFDLSTTGRIFEVSPGGILTLVAGHEANAALGDGGPAVEAGLGIVYAMAQDPAGNLYLGEWGRRRVRRVDAATGSITTVAGGGPAGATMDGIPASQAFLDFPFGLAFDASGNLYLSEMNGHRIRRVDAATGLITTVAGTGTAGYAGDGGPASSALLDGPREIAIDAAGNLYVADAGNSRIRMIEAATGKIVTVAGTGTQGYEGDGGPATSANLIHPSGLALDGAGNLYISDYDPYDMDGSWQSRVRRVDAATGIITRVAGGGTGDRWDVLEGIPATDAIMYYPEVVDVDAAGDLLTSDQGDFYLPEPTARVRKVDVSTGLINSLAGGGTSKGDGGLASGAVLEGVGRIAFDASGNLFIPDGHQIRRVDAATGIITLVAGDGTAGFAGDGGPATDARLNTTAAVVVDAAGNVFIADRDNHRIRRVDGATGIITTYAGDGTAGFAGDGRRATTASLNSPRGLALNADGDLYIADCNNHRIRVVDAQREKIDTTAGDGTPGYGGDGGPATSASLNQPRAVAVAASGNLLIADTENFRIRSVDAVTGIITTVAGDGTLGYGGDGGPATGAQLGRVGSLDVAGNGDLLLSDGTNNRVRHVVAATGIIDTVAGSGDGAVTGDGGLSTLAGISGPSGVALDGAGGFVLGDAYRVRSVSPTSAPTGAGDVPDGSPPTETPLAFTLAPLGLVTLSWEPSCLGGDIDYELYEGEIGAFAGHTPFSCSTGNATSVTFAPGPGNAYYLVVPRSFAREGSYGRDSAGVERPAALSACIPQEIDACP